MHVPEITKAVSVVVAASVGSLAADKAMAAETATKMSDVLATQLATELVAVFVVATLMESALSTFFNWRLYREFFNGRAVKTLVMIAFGYAVVKAFNYDVFHRIVGFAGGVGEKGLLSEFLSALVLAGGSAAIYELFKKLGFRPPVELVETQPTPSENHAWVSVKVLRRKALGAIRIHIDEIDAPTTQDHASAPIAGVVGEKSLGERLRGLFFADAMRFPHYGGRTVDAGKFYRITATGRLRGGSGGAPDSPFEEEIFRGRFADRAIIDLVHPI